MPAFVLSACPVLLLHWPDFEFKSQSATYPHVTPRGTQRTKSFFGLMRTCVLTDRYSVLVSVTACFVITGSPPFCCGTARHTVTR